MTSDSAKPIKQADFDRPKPINDARLKALEELSALDQELELTHGLTGNPMIKAKERTPPAPAGRFSALQRKGRDMTCPICDQKPANCDCTETEKRQWAEIEDLRLTDEERETIERLEDRCAKTHCVDTARVLRGLLERHGH